MGHLGGPANYETVPCPQHRALHRGIVEGAGDKRDLKMSTDTVYARSCSCAGPLKETDSRALF